MSHVPFRLVALPVLLLAAGCSSLTGLFDGTSSTWMAPSSTTDPSSGAAPPASGSLAASGIYGCALAPSGEPYCWGGVTMGFNNLFGLIDSVFPISSVPAKVPGNVHLVQLTAGGETMCGLDPEQAAYCWGPNEHGTVGTGTRRVQRSPARVPGGYHWKALDAGLMRTCGVALDGQAYCWGTFPSENFVPTPSAVPGGLKFQQIQVGLGTACAIADSGDTYCWGRSGGGLTGDGQAVRYESVDETPSLVVGSHHFVQLAAGDALICGLEADGDTWCWGSAKLGDGHTSASSTPVLVAGNHHFTSIAAGGGHACGITGDGAMYCWGSNGNGQLGIGSLNNADVPTRVSGSMHFAAVTAGGSETCGLTPNGIAYCWGQNNFGQLGIGTVRDPRSTPARVANRQ